MTVLTNEECPCCGRLMPEWKYYDKVSGVCRIVVMR